MVACRPPPPFPRKIEKTQLHCIFSKGENHETVLPAPASGQISTIFVSYESLWPLDMSSMVARHPPFSIYRKIKLWQSPSASTITNSPIYFAKLRTAGHRRQLVKR
ncbi:hypothetical protein AVEN_158485-1 [Araneus ventricosus]|uniref:Uncharacterized protein n=1 Tax=Araneus ventricosus TaxID=182803 RepID=A0A4Y2QHC3_ARAVE|nr:hypothetical protein AVEN_275321-1 [Araneus ventricosus]GBN62732.1 hypothetical protein AVEN_158485-1 [Araneus ventricosus]